MDRPTLTRRRIVTGTATLAAAGLGGLALGTDDARAEVTVGDGLTIADAEFSPDDAAVFTPWLIIEGAFAYSVPADPAAWECYCMLEKDGETAAIGMQSGEATAREAKGTYGLRGAVTAARFYEPADFAIPEGQQALDVTLAAEVVFVVRDAADAVLAQATAGDEATVTINRDGELRTAVSGSADVVMQDDQADPTPTPPGGE